VASLPGWLADAVNAPGKRNETAGPLQTIAEGTRNNELFDKGCSLRGKGKDEVEINTALRAINEAQCDPPLDAKEVESIAKSAASYPAGNAPSNRNGEKNQFWWFQVDANEYCKDIRIQLLSDYQFGWLMWLRIFAWTRQGYLPNQPLVLAKLARASNPEMFANEMYAVMAFFEVTDDETEIFDPELVAYWAEKTEQSEKNSRAGRASAAKRKKE
jgi:hypothetical protein